MAGTTAAAGRGSKAYRYSAKNIRVFWDKPTGEGGGGTLSFDESENADPNIVPISMQIGANGQLSTFTFQYVISTAGNIGDNGVRAGSLLKNYGSRIRVEVVHSKGTFEIFTGFIGNYGWWIQSNVTQDSEGITVTAYGPGAAVQAHTVFLADWAESTIEDEIAAEVAKPKGGSWSYEDRVVFNPEG
ncbi:unnamed protein product, partial [marine sediment metagenome]